MPDEAGALVTAAKAVPACHGFALEPSEIGFELGWLEDRSPRRVVIEVTDQVDRTPDAELVWQMEEPADLGLPAITSQTWREQVKARGSGTR